MQIPLCYVKGCAHVNDLLDVRGAAVPAQKACTAPATPGVTVSSSLAAAPRQGVSRQALQPEGMSGRPQPHLDGCNLLEKLFHMLVLWDLLRCSWRLHIPTGAAWPRGGLCALQDGQSKLWVRGGCAALPDCAPVLWSDRLLWLRRSLGSCQVQEHPANLMRQPCTAGRLNSSGREQQIQATCLCLCAEVRTHCCSVTMAK